MLIHIQVYLSWFLTKKIGLGNLVYGAGTKKTQKCFPLQMPGATSGKIITKKVEYLFNYLMQRCAKTAHPLFSNFIYVSNHLCIWCHICLCIWCQKYVCIWCHICLCIWCHICLWIWYHIYVCIWCHICLYLMSNLILIMVL
jgi:hypothetical protein